MNVYEFLWENNTDIANKTIRVDLLIQMQNGSLQAERYVNFTIQDINCVLNKTNMLRKMSANVTLPNDLKNFLKADTQVLPDFMLIHFFYFFLSKNR